MVYFLHTWMTEIIDQHKFHWLGRRQIGNYYFNSMQIIPILFIEASKTNMAEHH